ncbi:MAG TPA: YgeY family selenium metabolism-linked hydrolase [Feifaniaceae bacterium]|nr:YgeY family selenium metabolism-linked hydrolase [Feifaniaceae bacterium]
MDQTLYQNCLLLCADLIGEKSLSGEEMGAVNTLANYFRARGVGEIVVDRLGNLIVTLRGDRPGKTILFDGHLDTVPVIDAEQWTHPPFSATLEEERLYGRGASDMKCALACMAAAAANYDEQTGGHFCGNIVVAGVVHEECFEGVAAREISARVKPNLVVIGEASECNLKIGQRGRAEIVLETYGKSAHSANPEKGVNAVYHMTELVRRIHELVPPQSDVLGSGILELTDIKSAPYPGASVVPNYCRATYDRRLLVGETKESVLAPIQAAIDYAAKEIPSLSAKVSIARGEERCYTGETIQGERFFPGWAFPEGADFVQQALLGLRAGDVEAAVMHYNFCTNGSHYAGEAGIPTIGFGPSTETLAHTRDEWVALEQIKTALGGYLGLLGQFCPAE